MSSKSLILGDYVEVDESRTPLARLELIIIPQDYTVDWHRCGLTADFFADFFAPSFPDTECAMNALSTVCNELIENGVKFSTEKQHPVRVLARHFESSVILEATNSADADQADAFVEFVEGLLGEDPELLFLSRIEDMDFDEAAAPGGLGLITVKKDFLSGIGVRIRDLDAGRMREVKVQLHLDNEVLAG